MHKSKSQNRRAKRTEFVAETRTPMRECIGRRLREVLSRARLNSMKSPLLVVILIVTLLTCPMRCFACESHATHSDADACATCECCPLHEDALSTDAPIPRGDPIPHGEQCLCTNCICAGAVVETAAELPDRAPPLIWMLSRYLKTQSSTQSKEWLAPDGSTHADRMLSGRGALIAHQSWQI